ncbi:MAG: MCE family protein [Deltaproteobacteria bacterium]|nr:MCE family protein [Deltaproteobacteria bacterium]
MARITTEVKVGIFVILGLLLLIYMTATVGKWNLGGDKGYLVTVKFDSAAGLLKDSPVKVLGVTKGKVEKLEIEKDKAKVYMRLPRGLRLPEDSLVYVRSEGLLGEKYVEINPGSPDNPSVTDRGELLQGAPPADLDRLFSELSDVAKGIKNLTQMITQPAETTEGTQEKKTAIQSILSNLDETSESLKNLAKTMERGEGTVGKLLRDDTIYNELASTLSSVSATFKKLSSDEGTLGKLLSDEEVYNNVREISIRINNVIRKLEGGEGVIGKLFVGQKYYENQKVKQKKGNKADKEETEYVPLTALGSVLGKVTE